MLDCPSRSASGRPSRKRVGNSNALEPNAKRSSQGEVEVDSLDLLRELKLKHVDAEGVTVTNDSMLPPRRRPLVLARDGHVRKDPRQRTKQTSNLGSERDASPTWRRQDSSLTCKQSRPSLYPTEVAVRVRPRPARRTGEVELTPPQRDLTSTFEEVSPSHCRGVGTHPVLRGDMSTPSAHSMSHKGAKHEPGLEPMTQSASPKAPDDIATKI